jgi:hypothetical protein
MRHTVTEYIDAARARCGLDSDRALDRYLGFKSTAVSFWRRGRALPSDSAMISLAVAAGVDPLIGLIELAIWRAEAARDTRAISAWMQALEIIRTRVPTP